MYNTPEYLKKTSQLIQGIQALEMPILWLEQLPEKLGETQEDLKVLLEKTSKPISKAPFSAFLSDEYRDELEKSRRETVIICGIESHICVYQTSKDLIDRGYEVVLVADATSSRTEENCRIGIEAVRDLGAQITSVESLLFELLRTPEHPAFRAISKIVK